MDTRHLRRFQVVAEELHFGLAASKLNMDQAPLSRSIQKLEEHMGVKLFYRNAKSTALTPEGEILYAASCEIFSIIYETRSKIQASIKGYSGVLNIGVTDEIDIQRFSELLRLYRQNNPDVNIKLRDIRNEKVIIKQLDSLYDVIFSRTKIIDNNMICEKVWSDELVVLLPLKHPLLKYKEISFVELSQYTLLTLHTDNMLHSDKFNGYYEQVKSYLDSSDVNIPYCIEFAESYDQMLTLISAGLGIGLIDYATYTNMKNKNISFKRLKHKYEINMYMIYGLSTKLNSFKQLITRVKLFNTN